MEARKCSLEFSSMSLSDYILPVSVSGSTKCHHKVAIARKKAQNLHTGCPVFSRFVHFEIGSYSQIL